MSSKGLNKEIIILEAVKVIEESGSPTISLHELARRLKVKTPSLYNHIKNTEDLQHGIFQYAINQFVQNQQQAIANKQKDEAIRAFAQAYYSFAIENKGLYRLIMSMPLNNDDAEKAMAVPLLEMVMTLLSDYGLSEEAKVHWQRSLRAILHGFISQEDLGYFYHYKDVDSKESFRIAIECFLNGLNSQYQN